MAAGDNLGDQFYGRGLDSLFPEGSSSIRTAPWQSASRRKANQDYDPDVARHLLRNPPSLSEVDPRTLRATQPMIHRPGVEHYMGSEYGETGRTFADNDKVGNKFPLVYKREDGQSLILSGHHRAAAALAKGEPLRAIVGEGPWGPLRNSRK
jgi:hypothetical protein